MENRSELIVNEAYLDKVLKTITNKKIVRKIEGANLIQFDDGKSKVNILKRKNVKMIELIGTDFTALIGSIGEKVYKFRNKKLNIDYTLAEMDLGDDIKKRYILEKLGNEIVEVLYLIRGPELIILYYAKSNPSKDLQISLYNSATKDFNDSQLVKYANEQGLGIDSSGEILDRDYYDINSSDLESNDDFYSIEDYREEHYTDDDKDYESEFHDQDEVNSEENNNSQPYETRELPKTMREMQQHILHDELDMEYDEDDNIDEICRDIDELNEDDLDEDLLDDMEAYNDEFVIMLNGVELINGERKFNILTNINNSIENKDGTFFDLSKAIILINKEYRAMEIQLADIDVSDSTEDQNRYH